MFGKIVLRIFKFFRQTFCIHDYTVRNEYDGTQIITKYECNKCGRMKVK